MEKVEQVQQRLGVQGSSNRGGGLEPRAEARGGAQHHTAAITDGGAGTASASGSVVLLLRVSIRSCTAFCFQALGNFPIREDPGASGRGEGWPGADFQHSALQVE